MDEDDPLNSALKKSGGLDVRRSRCKSSSVYLCCPAGIDDGIRLEPFNMRREMREGHFDESGFYVLNKVQGYWKIRSTNSL